ncbi:hypothetical protein OCE40_13265 [Bacillus toyonensis]|uniref:hypothetical protein n=1 Tax=Bacillus toyonensis TaxID=155322 RepID=UPI0021D36336|nr:hypothetical protein [Bacillus toyonensis]MCU5302849.1 hypothetical protein [Bacillus toyonensis]
MKKILFLLLATIITLTYLLVFNKTIDSEIKGFPIPFEAKLIHTTEEIGEYVYKGDCFESGLSIWYQIHIKLKGWDKTFAEGGMKVYEKDNKKVTVIYLTGEDVISLYKE